jgi:predicted transcriptional regulator
MLAPTEIRDTSLQAYRQICDEGILNERQLQVYEALAQAGPLTASEIARHIKAPRDSVSPRLPELARKGTIAVVSSRDCDVTGRHAITWDVTETIKPMADVAPRPTAEEMVEALTEMRRLRDAERDRNPEYVAPPSFVKLGRWLADRYET